MNKQAIWYYACKGDSFGPTDVAGLQQAIMASSAPHTVMVWRPGLPDWQEAGSVSELAFLFLPPPQPQDRQVPIETTPGSSELADSLSAQLDAFWREGLATRVGGALAKARYEYLLAKVQAQIEHLPENEQDDLVRGLIAKNAEYIALGQKNRELLARRLGVVSAGGPSEAATASPSNSWKWILSLLFLAAVLVILLGPAFRS